MPLYVDINVLPKLNIPQFYVIATSDTTISLSFVGNNNASGVIYTIEELIGTTWTLVVNYTATSIIYSASFLHEGRTPNTNYTYRIRATNGNVNPSSDYEEGYAKTFLGGLPLTDCAKNKNLIVRMIRDLPLNNIYPKVFCLGINSITQKVEYTTSYLVANNPSTYEFCFQLLSLLKGCTYIGEDSTYGNIVMKFVNAPTDESVVAGIAPVITSFTYTKISNSVYSLFWNYTGSTPAVLTISEIENAVITQIHAETSTANNGFVTLTGVVSPTATEFRLNISNVFGVNTSTIGIASSNIFRYRNAILPMNPVYYSEFTETTGGVVDTISGSTTNFTLNNVTRNITGIIDGGNTGNKGISTSSTTGKLQSSVSKIPSSGAFTLVIWAKIPDDAVFTEHIIFSQYLNNDTSNYSVKITAYANGGSGNVKCDFIKYDVDNITISDSFSTGYQGQSVPASVYRIFVFGRESNGELFKASGSVKNAQGGIFTGNISTGDAHLLHDAKTATSVPNTISLDEYSIFNRALTNAEIITLTTAGS